MAGLRPLNTDEWMRSVESRIGRLSRRVSARHARDYGEAVYKLDYATGFASYSLMLADRNSTDPVDYRMRVVQTAAGIVICQGLAYATSARASGDTIIQLPPALAPDTIGRFPVLVNGASAGTVAVHTDGRITTDSSMAAGDYLSLGTVKFPAAGVATWTPLTLLNGWTAHTPEDNGAPAYWRDEFGFTWLRGRIAGGTTTDNTVYAKVPAGYASPSSYQMHMPSAKSPGGLSALGSDNGDDLQIKVLNSGATWISLAGNVIVTQTALDMHDWIIPGKLNSWVKFGTGQPDLMFAQLPDGRVHSYGLIKSGTLGTNIALIPEYMQVRNRRSMISVTQLGLSKLDLIAEHVSSNSNLTPGFTAIVSGSGTWFSWDAQVWFPDGTAR